MKAARHAKWALVYALLLAGVGGLGFCLGADSSAAPGCRTWSFIALLALVMTAAVVASRRASR